MKLKEKLEAGKYVVTAEISPPKGTNTEEFFKKALALKEHVDAVNVTDQQSAVMRMSSLASCLLLQKAAIEPVMQVTCRDRNAIALQSDLLGASALNVDTVLCLTGDHVRKGDHVNSIGVYELDSINLLQTIKKLAAGYDLSGKALKGSPQFFAGSSFMPNAEIPELEMLRIEKKVEAGADFFQTQCVFDVPKAQAILEKALAYKKPVVVGVMLLKSAAMAKYMNELPGIFVPDDIIEEMSSAANKREKGIEIAARIIKQVKDYCQGIHIMSLSQEEDIPLVIEKAQLK